MTWWQMALTGLISVGGAWATAKVTARSSEQAVKRTTAVQQKASDVEGLDRLAGRLESRLDKVEEDLEAAQKRIADLERDLHQERTLFSQAVEYIRNLLRVMRAHAVTAPEPPAPLSERL